MYMSIQGQSGNLGSDVPWIRMSACHALSSHESVPSQIWDGKGVVVVWSVGNKPGRFHGGTWRERYVLRYIVH